MSPGPLPHVSEAFAHIPAAISGTIVHTAYQDCVDLERTLTTSGHTRERKPSGHPEPHVRARILGNLLRFAPTDTGRTNLADEIRQCSARNDKLLELADFYYNHFLKCCKCFYN